MLPPFSASLENIPNILLLKFLKFSFLYLAKSTMHKTNKTEDVKINICFLEAKKRYKSG